MERKKVIPKIKEPIKLRIKKLANGNQSIYLDFYYEGKREYEFLKLYLIPKTSLTNKEANKETWKLANAIKAQKIVEIQNNVHGFSNRGAKSKANLIEYVEMLADRKLKKSGGDKRGTSMSYIALNHHLKELQRG